MLWRQCAGLGFHNIFKNKRNVRPRCEARRRIARRKGPGVEAIAGACSVTASGRRRKNPESRGRCPVASCRIQMALRPFGKRWHRPTIADVCERHGRHCRSGRSTARFRDLRFCRRDGAIRRWRQAWARRHWSRSEPTPVPGCTPGRDLCRLASACTSRTTQQAVRRRNSRANGDDDNDDALWLLRLMHKRRVTPSRRRFYAYCLPSSCFRERDR
jgi:hypothetical protein